MWLRLAPQAVAAGTLTLASEYAFGLLCRNIVLERRLAKREAGSAAHRGLIQRLDSELRAFLLSPLGKPLVPPAAEKPIDPFAEFDDHANVQ